MNKKKIIAVTSAVLCVVTTLNALKKRRNLKRKKCWIRPDLIHRATGGFYSTLRCKLQEQDSHWFQNFLLMSLEDFDCLVERLTPYIYRNNTCFRKAISVGERLAVTLRYLATGNSFSSLRSVFLVGKATICNIIHETCGAIFEALKDEFLKVPKSAEKWTEIADHFEKRWNFPNCCGALEGRHVMLHTPANCSSNDLNYRDQNSVVLTTIVDAEYKFLFVDVEAYDCGSDGEFFTRCQLSTALAENTINFPMPRPLTLEADSMPFVIIADDPFPLKSYLLKPFSYSDDITSHKIFNYRLYRAKKVADNAFGICAARFRILRKPIDVKPHNVKAIILAICVLHNFLITRKSVYMTRADVDDDRDGEIVPGNWRLELAQNEILSSLQTLKTTDEQADNALKIRLSFMEYFMTPHGELSGQYDASA